MKEELVPSRQVISDKICNLISDNKSYRLGISGNWGSGKSTIANNIVENHEGILYIDVWEYQYIENIEDMIFLAILKNEGINLSDQKKILDYIKDGKSALISLGFKSAEVIASFNGFDEAVKAIKKIINLVKKNNTSDMEELFKILMNSSEIVNEMIKQKKYSCIIFDELDRVTYDVVVKVIQYCQFFNTYYKDIVTSTLIIYNKSRLQGMLKHVYGDDFDFEAYNDKIFTHDIFDLETNADSLEKILEKKGLSRYKKEIAAMFDVCKSIEFNTRELLEFIKLLDEKIFSITDMKFIKEDTGDLTSTGKAILFFVILIKCRSYGAKTYKLTEAIEKLTSLKHVLEINRREIGSAQINYVNNTKYGDISEASREKKRELVLERIRELHISYLDKVQSELETLLYQEDFEIEDRFKSSRFQKDLKELYKFLYMEFFKQNSNIKKARAYDYHIDLGDIVKKCEMVINDLIKSLELLL